MHSLMEVQEWILALGVTSGGQLRFLASPSRRRGEKHHPHSARAVMGSGQHCPAQHPLLGTTGRPGWNSDSNRLAITSTLGSTHKFLTKQWVVLQKGTNVALSPTPFCQSGRKRLLVRLTRPNAHINCFLRHERQLSSYPDPVYGTHNCPSSASGRPLTGGWHIKRRPPIWDRVTPLLRNMAIQIFTQSRNKLQRANSKMKSKTKESPKNS